MHKAINSEKFANELEAAGLLGLPISWSETGELHFTEHDPEQIRHVANTLGAESASAYEKQCLSREQASLLRAVYAAHDPAPTPAQLAAPFERAVQSALDAAARALGYDNINTAVSYADEDAVERFQAEGRALRRLRSLTWAKCYAVLGDVLTGKRAMPTEAQLLDELPTLELPA